MIKETEELSALWGKVCLGDQYSYTVLHKKLYRALLAYGMRILKDEDLVEDMIQDMFIKLWIRKESIGAIGNVKGYFFAVMRSICLDFLRSQESNETRKAAFEFLDYQHSIEEVITQRESTLKQRRVIELALKRLPARQREILQLRYFESLNCAEIGRVTGIKYQSVVNHMYRAVQALRDMYPTEDGLRVA